MQSELLNEFICFAGYGPGRPAAALKSTAGQVGQQSALSMRTLRRAGTLAVPRSRNTDSRSCNSHRRMAPASQCRPHWTQVRSVDLRRTVDDFERSIAAPGRDRQCDHLRTPLQPLCAGGHCAGRRRRRSGKPDQGAFTSRCFDSETANRIRHCEQRGQAGGRREIGCAERANWPPDALATRFDAIDHDVKNIAPAFAAMEKELIDKAGANGVKSYARIVEEFRRVIPKGTETKLDIKECLLDLWDELQTVQHPLGGAISSSRIRRRPV